MRQALLWSVSRGAQENIHTAPLKYETGAAKVVWEWNPFSSHHNALAYLRVCLKNKALTGIFHFTAKFHSVKKKVVEIKLVGSQARFRFFLILAKIVALKMIHVYTPWNSTSPNCQKTIICSLLASDSKPIFQAAKSCLLFVLQCWNNLIKNVRIYDVQR